MSAHPEDYTGLSRSFWSWHSLNPGDGAGDGGTDPAPLDPVPPGKGQSMNTLTGAHRKRWPGIDDDHGMGAVRGHHRG